MDQQNQNTEFSEVVSETAAEESIYKKQREYSAFECIFAWLCILFGYLFCRAFPPAENPLGMFILEAAVVIVTLIILYNKKGVTLNIFAVISALLSVVFAFTLLLSDETLTSFIALACSVAAYCYFVYTATGNRSEKGFSDFIPLDLFNSMVIYPLSAFGKVFRAMFARKSKGVKTLLKILAGFAIAVIPTAFVVWTLSYDSEFVKLYNQSFSFLFDLNPFSHLLSLGLGCLVAMYVFGIYAASTNDKKPDSVKADYCREFANDLRRIPALTIAAALIPILTVYVIFFVSQWQYYVSAFGGTLPTGVQSYAEYARSGFFELCKVSVVNFIILIAVSVFLRRKGTAEKIFLKSVSVIISLMSLVLIGTAMSKMMLYIDTYGLTEKRVLSSWFMILLSIIFLLVIVRQFIAKIKIVSASSVAVAVMLGVLTMSNYTGMIADYNVDMYIEGKTDSIDIDTIYEHEVSSVPALVRLAEHWESNGETVKHAEYKLLVHTLKYYKTSLDTKSVTAFSFPLQEARDALDEYFGE